MEGAEQVQLIGRLTRELEAKHMLTDPEPTDTVIRSTCWRDRPPADRKPQVKRGLVGLVGIEPTANRL